MEDDPTFFIVGQCPCDDCGNREACRQNETACRSFQAFVEGDPVPPGRIHHPTVATYQKIFKPLQSRPPKPPNPQKLTPFERARAAFERDKKI